MPDLSGRNAVITGAAHGIGRAMAVAFARRGANVLASDVDATDLNALMEGQDVGPGKIAVAACDVSDYASVAKLRDTALELLGNVDILCNNAGVRIRRRGMYATHEDWSWVLGVNLWGVVHGVELFLPGMLASGVPCHIVNTSSMHGVVPSPFSAVYGASKYGVVGLTETLRNELKDTNVKVSLLLPGPVDSDIKNSERRRPAHLASQARVPEEVAGELSGVFALTNRIPPADVAELVLAALDSDEFYLFTDPGIAREVEERHRALMSGFDFLRRWQESR